MSHTITLEPFSIEFPCSSEETILEAAFRAGLSLRYGCKHGGCGGCKHKITEGEVDYNDHATAISEEEIDDGIALLCCAYPEEDLVITLDDDYQEAELTPEFPLQVYKTSITEINHVTHDTVHLVMKGNVAAEYNFNPGQYLEVRVPGTELWRSFSMANIPNPRSQTELIVKLIPNGAFSDYLKHEATSGAPLEFRGPYGQFQLTETNAEIIMIAGGSGMAPIVSMLQKLVAEKSEREITFYYGARSIRDLYFISEIESLGEKLANFKFIPALSEPCPNDKWLGETGFVTDALARSTGSLRAAEGYLCGPPPMIDAAIDTLRQKGMFNSRIRFDKFVQNT